MAETILEQLAACSRKRVAGEKELRPFGEIRAQAQAMPVLAHAFARALSDDGLSFICEIKKASPSKGVIDPVFDYLGIARAYQKAGVDAVSCLTEPTRFLGSDQVFATARHELSVPMLRKDFTVDPYQIYQARIMGADAVLLICALLDDAQLEEGLSIADNLGMDALVEAHDAAELARAARAGARIVGVNNRNLHDFSVENRRAAALVGAAPHDALFVAESGIRTPTDVHGLSAAGVDAVLVGEAFMRAEDKAGLLQAMREEAAR